MADVKAVVSVRGFKIVDANLRGMGQFQYSVGKTATTSGRLEVCRNGLHFCRYAAQCYQYARHLERPWRYLCISAQDVLSEGNKSASLALHIDAEMTPREWLDQIMRETSLQTTVTGKDIQQLLTEPLRIITGTDEDATLPLALAAAEAGDIKVVSSAAKVMSASPMTYHLKSPFLGWDHSVVIAAAGHGRDEIVQLVIDMGVMNNIAAIRIAASCGHISTMKILIQNEIASDDSVLNKGSCEPLLHRLRPGTWYEFVESAVRNDQLDVVKFLLSPGIGNADIANYVLRTAARFDNRIMMLLAVEKGATGFLAAITEAIGVGQNSAVEFMMKISGVTEAQVTAHIGYNQLIKNMFEP